MIPFVFKEKLFKRVFMCECMCVFVHAHPFMYKRRKIVGIIKFWVVTSRMEFYFSLYILLCQFKFYMSIHPFTYKNLIS